MAPNELKKLSYPKDGYISYKSKYQTGDISSKVGNIKTFYENSFENRSSQKYGIQQKRQAFDAVSQGSTDNIL